MIPEILPEVFSFKLNRINCKQFPFIPFEKLNPPEGIVVTCKLSDGTYQDFYFVYARQIDGSFMRVPLHPNGKKVTNKVDLVEWVRLPIAIRQEFKL